MAISALRGVYFQFKIELSGSNFPFQRIEGLKHGKKSKFPEIFAFLNFRKLDLYKKLNISFKTNFDLLEMPQNGPNCPLKQILGVFMSFLTPGRAKISIF